MCVCRLHEFSCEAGGKLEKRDDRKKINMFEVNAYCDRYEKSNRARDLRRCKRQDCAQELSKTGCKYMSKEGYCYRRNGQRYCEDSPDLEQCLTRDQVTDPKRPMCPQKRVELKIHRNCDRYKLRKRPRYLRRCELQDCRQAKSEVGCKYMNDDGFCYTAPGQRYCAEDAEDAEHGAGDPRCLTSVADPLHPVCQASQSYESKLPNPADVGLVPGLRVKFYYIGEAMDKMPNVRKRVPNFVAAAEELHFDDDAAFKALDSKLPDDNWALDIDGVIAVEERGEHSFFMRSDDGSHLWVDGRKIIDNGGLHGAEEEKEASIVLDAGYHTIKVNLFENSHTAALNVMWKGPSTENRKDYVNGYYFKNAEPESESENSLPAPADVGLTGGFLMKVYSTNMPAPLDRVPALDSMTPDMTARTDYVDFASRADFRAADLYTTTFKTASLDIPDDNFAIEWEGVISVATSGEYKFYLGSDDGSNLWVDGKMLIDNDGLHGFEQKEGTMQLTRGYHAVKIDFFESGGEAAVKAEWSGPGIAGTQPFYGYHFSKPPRAPLTQEECCQSVCVEPAQTPIESDEAVPTSPAAPPHDAPPPSTEAPPSPVAPPPDAPPPPTDVNVCSIQADGTCKSMLNIRCADWRDKADTWRDSKQLDYIQKCMGQDCEQSMESGSDTPGCRFLDGNGFCYAYNSAQTWCGNAGLGSPYCKDGGADWAQPPLGNAETSQTGWIPGTFPYRGSSADKGSMECACMKDCTCTDSKCYCVNENQPPVGPVSAQT